jgi:nucleoside-triphosphatase
VEEKKKMAQSVLLTGHPGIGKTTIIRHTVAALGDLVGGFYTEEIAGPGGRHGFRLVTLRGQTATLAHRDLRDPKYPRLGRFGIDVREFERVGVRALRKAMEEGKMLIVDEIGPMELYSQSFQDVLMEAFMGPHHVIGTIMNKPNPAADVFKFLSQVDIWEVDRRNRDRMAGLVLKWARDYL